MITLYGFAISNYYNKVKLALLEKDIEFCEEAVRPSQEESLLRRSPLGKIPFIETEHGTVSESQAIVEYLEDAYSDKPLYPADHFNRAKCRELIQHLELNAELVARRVYGEAFFGTPVSQETKDEVKAKLDVSLKGVARIAAFRPYVCSENLTAADCAAWPHLTLIAAASEKIYGENLVATHLPGAADYLTLMESRPAVQKVAADRAVALEAFYASRK